MRLTRLSFLLLIPAIPMAQAEVDRRLGRFRPHEEILYFQTGEHLRKLVPGFENLVADVYWLRTVQYFGSQFRAATPGRFQLLYPLVDVATTLDPRLLVAYKAGAIFLCEPWPIGKGDPEAGIRILEKGVKANPGDWRLLQDKGYYRYLFLKDAVGAAEDLMAAAKIPDSGPWLASLADIILRKSGDRDTARQVWLRLYEQQEEGHLKRNALDNLLRLDALDAIDALDAFVARFVATHGRRPHGVDEMLRAGLDSRLLVDATGVPFKYFPADGTFWMTNTSRLWIGKPPR